MGKWCGMAEWLNGWEAEGIPLASDGWASSEFAHLADEEWYKLVAANGLDGRWCPLISHAHRHNNLHPHYSPLRSHKKRPKKRPM